MVVFFSECQRRPVYTGQKKKCSLYGRDCISHLGWIVLVFLKSGWGRSCMPNRTKQNHPRINGNSAATTHLPSIDHPVHPPPINHVLTDRPTTAVQQQYSCAGTAVHRFARGMWYNSESKRVGGFRVFFFTRQHLGERASRQATSTHGPLPSHRPTEHSSTTAAQQ